jgi:hypothetical protein
MQKAAEYFKVDYRSARALRADQPQSPLGTRGGSILNHLDTNLATLKGGKSVLLFSNELSKPEKDLLLNNVKKGC